MKVVKSFYQLTIAIAALLLLSHCSSNVKPENVPTPLSPINSTVNLNKLWSQNIGSLGRALYPLTPTLADGLIYTVNTQGIVRAFDQQTGKLQWHTDLQAPVSTGITIHSGYLYVGTHKGEILAVSLADSQITWRAQLPGELLAAPQVNGSLVIGQTTDGTLIALNKLTGTQVWIYAANQPPLTLRSNNTPLALDPVTFAGFTNGNIALFDNRDGHKMWEFRIATPQGNDEIEQLTDIAGQPILTNDGRLFVNSYHGYTVSLNVQNGQVLWAKPMSSYQSPLLVGNSLFITADQGQVWSLNAHTGATNWQQKDLLNRQLTAPAFINGQIAVGDYQGYIHLLKATNGVIDGRILQGGQGFSVPLLVHDHLLFALSNNGNLVTYQIKETTKP